MDENNNIQGREDDGIAYRPTLRSRLDNFWYHYKWHSIVAAFLVIVITVCSLQMCTKESYDAYIIYSGSYYIDRKSDGGVPEYLTFTSSLERVVQDFDSNGEVAPSLLDLFVLSPEQIAEEEEKKEGEVNQVLLQEDFESLEYQIVYGNEYFVCFLSEYCYNKFKVIDGINMFLPLQSYAPNDAELEYLSEDAIYLNSTEFGKLPGFKNLPADTVICLKSINTVSSLLNKKQVKARHEEAEIIIKNILAYGE